MARATPDVPEGTRALQHTRRILPTWRAIVSLLVAVLAVALAYLLGRAEYLVIAGLAVLLPAAGLLFVRVRRPKLDVVRLFSPPVVAVGGLAQVTVRVTNLGVTPSTALAWDDALPWFEPLSTRELPTLRPGPRHTRTSTYDLHPPRRGLYAIGPFVAEYDDPFGMATSTVAIGAPDRLVVVPAVSSLSEGGPTLADGDGQAHLVQRRSTGNDDDLTTREYRRGDALRRVHWRASARHGQLMVRQEEPRSHPDARLLVDTRRGGYPDAVVDTGFSWGADWASERFEWVVRMVASLGLHLEAAGFRVAIEETAHPQIEPLGDVGDRHRAEGFLTSLAGVQLLDPALSGMRAFGAAEGTGPLFAILGDPEPVVVDALVARRRPGEAGFAFLVGAAVATGDRLRDAGWTVIDADPRDDPSAAWRAAATVTTGVVRGAR